MVDTLTAAPRSLRKSDSKEKTSSPGVPCGLAAGGIGICAFPFTNDQLRRRMKRLSEVASSQQTRQEKELVKTR